MIFAQSSAVQRRQVIILKLDDVLQSNEGGGPVALRWKRITEYLETNHIKGSFGIICSSLEGDNQTYFDWIKSKQKQGLIEFWLHGYKNRDDKDTGEFEHGTFEEQKAILEKCETLAKEKLGFPLTAFGEHWSSTTVETGKALEAIPEIKILFGGELKDTKKFVLPRIMGLEIKTGLPVFDKFKAEYEKVGASQEFLRLQGHPALWDDKKWGEFVKIIDYLKSKGCVFMTPSEYFNSKNKK